MHCLEPRTQPRVAHRRPAPARGTPLAQTGKRSNPHLIRDSIVTYLRGSGASERELEVGRRPGGGSNETQAPRGAGGSLLGTGGPRRSRPICARGTAAQPPTCVTPCPPHGPPSRTQALAIYMGHSVEMQRDTYDRRTKQQKVGGGGGGPQSHLQALQHAALTRQAVPALFLCILHLWSSPAPCRWSPLWSSWRPSTGAPCRRPASAAAAARATRERQG